MKKITLIFFLTLISFCSYGQLALEGFEGTWSPADGGTATTGWFQFQNSVGLNEKWAQGPTGNSLLPPYEGLRAAYLQRENVAPGILPEDYLVTPQFNVPLEPELRFYSRLTIAGDQGSIYKVFIVDLTTNPTANLNAAASYTELQSWTELQINPVQTEYNEVVVELPAEYVGKNVRIAFMMTGDNFDRWLVDNVKVVKKCLAPETLEVVSTTLTTADLSWANPTGATSWEIEVVEDAGVPTGTGVTYSGTLPYHATTLSNGTPLVEGGCYKYYVRSLCDGGGVSAWAGAFYFCTKITGSDCNFPIVINSLPFSDQDNTSTYSDVYEGNAGTGCNTSTWENYLTGNDVVYRYTASFTGMVDVDLSENGQYSGIFVYDECSNIGVSCLDGGTGGWEGNPVSLEDFPVVAGEDYYFVISSSDQQTTPYQLIIQAVACDEPTNLSVGTTGLTTALLSWDNPSGATSWEVAVQPAGSSIPSGAGTTVTDNSDFLWTNLTASTAYQYWVRADCANGSFSAWAGPYMFHTQVCDVIFQCEFTFTMWDEFSWDTWNGDKVLVKQNGLTIATLTGPQGDGTTSVVTVPVCNNLPVQLVWQTGGNSWAAEELGLSVKNSFNQTIFTKNPGTFINNPQLYEVVVDCEQPYCLPPEDLTATNATLTTVDLGWAGDATGNWDYYIVPEGSPAPTDATPGTPTTTNPTIGAGPLVASTDYEYYVRMHCTNSSTSVSGWAGPFAFSSSVCDPVEKCSYNFILNAPWDGWDGVVLTVRQNDTNVAVLGSDFTAGDGDTMTVPVALCNGVPFEVILTDDGDWAGQVGLEIVNNFDQSIFFRDLYGDGSSGMVLFTDAVDCLHPKCLPPTGLASANGTMTSIDLSWDGPATGSWEYVVLPAGSPAPTAATPGTPTTANPTVAVPLAAPATNYDFYVRLVCTDATDPASTWAGPLAIHSEVCDAADKCVFHFELLSDGGYGFGSQTMTVYQAGVPVAVLGPGFDWNSPNQDSMMVDVPLCPNEEIEIVWDNTGSWDDYDKGLHVYSPYMEDVYIKPFGEGAQGDTLFTGLVSCDPPACLKPLNLSVSDIELNSVTLAWDEMGSATSWEVWVLPYGSPAPTGPGTVVTENPVSWPNLIPGTPYQFYVRANCEGDGYSTWTGPFAFVTAIANDECAGAINVPVNTGAICSTVVAGTMSGSTSSGLMPSCYWMEPENDVWYSFVATGPNHVVSVKNLVGVEVAYALYEGGCDGLNEIACKEYSFQDQAAVGVLTGLTAGQTYYVQVYATYFPDPADLTSFDVCVSSPASIVVDTTMGVENIVTSSLVVESCATFENITWSTGSDFGSVNGIGRFEKGLSTFGIEEGVVLMTGNASEAPGPNVGGPLGGYPDAQWPGDAQLFNYMTGLGIDVGTYNDATVLEFDFTPLANKLRFPFIFASEEYGDYQCSYSDAFAFFLTPLDENGDPAGPTTNLAVVPGTNSPVSVVTIRDAAFNDGCNSVNPDYFDNFYGTDPVADLTQAIDPMFAPINFDGMTIRMNAESDVVAGQKYHIKLVIADRGDSSYDSAVFIGAFDIGKPDLGVDLTIADGNGICDGESYTIASDLDPTDYTFTWYEKPIGADDADYTVINGETSNELTVTANGEYKLVASFGGLCEANDTVVVEFYPDVEEGTGNPTQLVVCDADGFATFNLSDNTDNILTGPNGEPLDPDDYTISYHLTAEDAQGDLNALPLTGYENTVQGLQEIYVRIVTKDGCVGVKSFSLIVEDRTPHFAVNEDFAICEGTTGTITVTPTEPVNYDPATVTYTWTKDGFAYAGTTASITVTEAGLYEVTIDNQGCPGTDSVVVSVTPTPVADDPADVDVCGKYVLPELSANNNYYTGPGGTGTMLSANDEITSTQTIYVFAYSELTPACTSENSFVVNVVPEVFVNIAEKCEGNNYILEAMFDDDSVYNADNVTFEWTNESGASLGNGATLTIVEQGKYFLTATPAGQEIACPKTVEVQVDSTTCDIPRGISPNNDGYNDSFDLSTLDVEELKIFNRYGQEVYSKRNYTNEWMGQTSKGDELPTGTYFYMIKRSNGESKTGWVYINRQE